MSRRDSARGQNEPTVNWERAPLPSNRVTLGQLRHSIGRNSEELGKFVQDLNVAEMGLVVHAFEEALSRSHGDKSGADAEGHFKKFVGHDLANYYPKIGFGKHQAAEFIRRLEAWAVAEARKHARNKAR